MSQGKVEAGRAERLKAGRVSRCSQGRVGQCSLAGWQVRAVKAGRVVL